MVAYLAKRYAQQHKENHTSYISR